MNEEWFQTLSFSCFECKLTCFHDCYDAFKKYGNNDITVDMFHSHEMGYLAKYIEEEQFDVIRLCPKCQKNCDSNNNDDDDNDY